MTEAQQAAGAARDAPLDDPRRRAGWFVAWTLLAALHLILVFAFVPPQEIFSERPISDIDYSIHYYQVDRAVRAFRSAGHVWAWDPGQLAGYPAGTMEDMSSKTLVLFVIGLTSLGVPQGLAFNLYVLLIRLLVPLVGLAAARAFGLRRTAVFVLTLLWVLLWHFDSFIHWCWYCGMMSWPLASGLAVVTVGMVHRTFQLLASRRSLPRLAPRPFLASLGPSLPRSAPRRTARLPWLAAAFGCAAVGLFHPLATAVVAVPCAAIYLALLWRTLRPADLRRAASLSAHLFVVTCIASTTLTALIWLLPALPIWHYVNRLDVFLRPSPVYLLYDFFDLHMSATATGPPVQTLLRFLCLSAAAIGLWRWQRERDSRYLPLAVMVGMCLLFAYFGKYVRLTSTAQPYRLMAPATLAATVPAAVLLADLCSLRALRSLSRTAAALLVICALLLVARVVHTFVFYFPSASPFIYFERGLPVPQHPINTVLAATSRKMENRGPSSVFRDVANWLRVHHNGRGRVLVQDYEMGEYLAVETKLPIIGGFAYRPLHQGDANLFHYERRLTLSDAELRAYLERYAIGFVVMRKIHWTFENKKALLHFREAFGALEFRIFETTIQPDYLLRGRGRVVSQELNRLVVEDAEGSEAVLRFHWLDSLRCRPACVAERAEVDGDRVGFIRVRRPPPRFEIYNSYVFSR